MARSHRLRKIRGGERREQRIQVAVRARRLTPRHSVVISAGTRSEDMMMRGDRFTPPTEDSRQHGEKTGTRHADSARDVCGAQETSLP